jgi:hypothetical protein
LNQVSGPHACLFSQSAASDAMDHPCVPDQASFDADIRCHIAGQQWREHGSDNAKRRDDDIRPP